jgi:hypothetical protein
MRSATASPIRRHFGPFAGFSDIFFLIFKIRAMLLVFDDKAADRRRNEAGMVQEMAPARRPRIGAQGMILRLREGLSYDEIASEEGVTSERIRQIVADVLQKRSVESGVEHAKLQLDRLAPVMQLAAEAVAAGDVTAIAPYLKVLDRFDRYQTVAGANQAYDEEARKKLFDKINRVAANLDVDEVMRAAAREHLRKLGMIPEEAATAEGDAAANPPPAAAEEKT